jgi:hypothetical protein
MLHGGLTAANPAAAIVLNLKGLDLALFIAGTAPQLLGEGLVTAIPFLALLTVFTTQMKLSRRTAVIAAWIGSAALFGLLHLSTYQWHLGQVLLIHRHGPPGAEPAVSDHQESVGVDHHPYRQ